MEASGSPSPETPEIKAERGEKRWRQQLIREWKREKFVVTVRPEGDEVRGRIFKSLSGAAKFITGTNWNGTDFFGISPRQAALA